MCDLQRALCPVSRHVTLAAQTFLMIGKIIHHCFVTKKNCNRNRETGRSTNFGIVAMRLPREITCEPNLENTFFGGKGLVGKAF